MNPQSNVAGALFPSLLSSPLRLRYDAAESEAANKAWKATCGPHSIAAAMGVTLEEVRAALVNYKGWMSPTQVIQTLTRLGQKFTLTSGLNTQELCNGINRIQWEGKWLNPGVPPRIAYFYTHYVAHFNGWVLCTACLSSEWISVTSWRRHHLTVDPVSPFHITHHFEFSEETA